VERSDPASSKKRAFAIEYEQYFERILEQGLVENDGVFGYATEFFT
jgi:hypothetical protein